MNATLPVTERLASSRERMRAALQGPARDSNAAEVAYAMVLLPLAKAHPLKLVGAALLLGMVLVGSRPWRWLLRPGLLAQVVPGLLAQYTGKGSR